VKGWKKNVWGKPVRVHWRGNPHAFIVLFFINIVQLLISIGLLHSRLVNFTQIF